MKKLIKLLLLAVVVVGVIVGLMYVIAPNKDKKAGPDVTSAEAKNWKEKIDALCKEGKWNSGGYNSIETGIHTDRVTSNGELISIDEENALQNYLFNSSCNYLFNSVDKLFKQSNYPANMINSAENMQNFLMSKRDKFGSNSNLTKASAIFSEYHRLMGLLSFSSNATYSQPLKEFKAVSAESAKSQIKKLQYYGSHFSKNTSIKSQVDNLESNRAKAESEYYVNLAKAVENHYKSTHDFDALLDDQIRFSKISTNSTATSRLNSFVNNPNR